jgi:hypothetical protein
MKVNKEVKDMINTLIQQGFTKSKIAENVGVHFTLPGRWLKEGISDKNLKKLEKFYNREMKKIEKSAEPSPGHKKSISAKADEVRVEDQQEFDLIDLGEMAYELGYQATFTKILP